MRPVILICYFHPKFCKITIIRNSYIYIYMCVCVYSPGDSLLIKENLIELKLEYFFFIFHSLCCLVSRRLVSQNFNNINYINCIFVALILILYLGDLVVISFTAPLFCLGKVFFSSCEIYIYIYINFEEFVQSK